MTSSAILLLASLFIVHIKLVNPSLLYVCKFINNSHLQQYSLDIPDNVDLSPSLFNVTSLSLVSKRTFSSPSTATNSSGYHALGILVLACCGDVHANPGPITNPCMGCSRPVAKNHRAMGCDKCSQWIHIACGNVTPKDYALFQRNLDPYQWKCPRCDPPPATDGVSSNGNDSLSADSDHSNDTTTDMTNENLQTTPPVTKDGNKIKLLIMNMNSVFSKKKGAALKAHIASSSADIIVGNESNLTSDRVDSDFLPPGYQAIRLDKSKDRHGVFVAHRDNLVVTPVELENPDPKCEFVLTKIQVVGKPDLYVGSFYRHCNADVSSLKSMYDNVVHVSGNKKIPNMIIAGDFNLPDADWESGTHKPSPQYGKEVNEKALELMSDLFMTQVVTEVTRGKNTLDLLFTTCPDLVENIEVGPGISDHDSVSADVLLRAHVSRQKPRKVYMYAKADQGKMRQEIQDLGKSFKATCHKRDANENWNYFTNGLKSIVDNLVPTKFVKTRNDLPWLTPRIRKNIKKKNRSHQRAKRAPPKHRPRLMDAYRQRQKAVQKQINEAHENYMESLFQDESGNPAKSFFRAIKAKKRDSVGVSPLRPKKGAKLESSSKGKAGILLNQYSSVFKSDNNNPVPKIKGSRFSRMPKIKVGVAGVEKLLKALNPKKAIGPDKVPTCLLKEHADLIAPILQVIYQQSLDSGQVPLDWKKADVVPVFKKGNKNTPSNYRPVSLTSISCKVLEHIVFSSVMEHVDKFKILNFFQHGFRKQHSCETQLINTIEDLARGLELRQQIDLLILDFSKAFDVVSHRLLLAKLEHYGIRDSNLAWLTDWLTDRTQRVVVEGECSDNAPVLSGVPQGTVLGPLMFLLYINDINADTNCSIRLFADDCLLYRVVDCTKDAAALQWDLKQLCRWADDWRMDFNPSKCYVLSITKRQVPLSYPYTINGIQLEHVKSHPYLGLELDSTLSWNQQLKKTLSKSQRNLNLLRRNLHGCSTKTKETAYKTLVRPTLEYASSAWDSYQQTQIDDLERVQNKAARFVCNQYQRDASVSAMKEALDWRFLQERRLIARLTLWYKALHGQAAVHIPPYYKQTPVPSPNSDTPKTRSQTSHNSRFQAPTATIDNWKYSYFQRTIRTWNILPNHLITPPTQHINDSYTYEHSINQFKTNLQKEFQSGTIYVVPPRGIYNRPRLGSTAGTGPLGPVY